MNKVYLVSYNSKEGINLSKVRGKLDVIGKVVEWFRTRDKFASFLFPSDNKDDAVSIRNKLKEGINPFEEGVAAIEVNELDMADTESFPSLAFQKRGKISILEKDGQRNFNRFKTRHEAFVAYGLEKPIWTYPDNIGNAIRMDINEWLWMPIKKDGLYERGKFEKYLG